MRVKRRTLIAQAKIRFTADAGLQLLGHPGFSDPGLTGQQSDLTFTISGALPAAREQIHLFLPADKVQQIAGCRRIEPALDLACADYPGHGNRLAETLQFVFSEVLEVEGAPDEPACGGRDQQRAGLCE